MNLLLFKHEYTCRCGDVFNIFDLIGEHSYGEFIMKSEVDELVYLNSFKAKEFDEFSLLLKKNKKLKNKNDREIAEIFHTVFSLACDLSPHNKLYFMDKHPNCPKCLSPYNMVSWTPLYPYEVREMDIKEVTFNEWNQLVEEEKKNLIDNGLKYVIEKIDESKQRLKGIPLWPNLTKDEREELLRIKREMNENKFKYLLEKFRSIRGLNVSSPIG